MKNLHLTVIILFLSVQVFAQEWKPYKIDDSIQVSLPEKFVKMDTLGQVLITSDSPFGMIQISITPDNPKNTPDIEKARHLKRYYDNFISRIRTAEKNGVISEEKDITIGKLKAKDFVMSVDSGSGKSFRNIRILHENGNTYAFQYLYKDIHAEYALPESRTFFKSIKITGADNLQSQFTDPNSTTGKTPPGGNKNLYIAGGIFLLILIALFILRRRRTRSA